jgi:hypothetical protein
MENAILNEIELDQSELYGTILEEDASTLTQGGSRGLAPEGPTGSKRWPR